MKKRDMYNSSGYLDMTAYLALLNIERAERKQAKEKAEAATKTSPKGAKKQ